jgi:photosystem II stability/assembly factor-like uncharacterized protein
MAIKENSVFLLIGTRKGAFIAKSDAGRKVWTITGSVLAGNEVNHLAVDRQTRRMFLAGKSAWWGPGVQISDDLGDTWRETKAPLAFAEGRDKSVERVWMVKADARAANRVYAGVDPGALFVSDDGGDSWRELPSLTDHETRKNWFPGAGGLMVHSMAFDPSRPSRLMVGISAAGAFRSEDDGATWTPKNTGVRADFLPDKFPLVGQCVHHMEMHPSKPDVLYQQNHCGVYRSDDAGDTWNDISEGLPSRFGFPIGVLPQDGDTIFVVPEQADTNRTTPDGAFRVYRSRDRGQAWQALTDGLPQANAHVNVMRMALTTDSLDTPGVYIGTQGGQIVASRDGGDHWEIIFNWLPPVYSLETVVVD